jgi:fucose permease
VLVAIAGRVPSFTLLALALAGTGLLSLAAALGAGAAAFAPAGFFVGIFFPAFFVAATRLMGGHPRVAPAIMAAGLAGGIAVPPLMTQGMAWGGDGILFSAAALLSLAAAAAALALLRGFNAAGPAAAQA